MTRILSLNTDSNNNPINLPELRKPTLTIEDRFYILRSNIEALELDYRQQILWLNEQIRLYDVSAGTKDIHSASQQILNLIENVNDKTVESVEVGNDLEHLRYKIRVLEETCDWSKPADDMVNTVVRICQNETERLREENEFLRGIIKASKDKGNEGSEDDK